jgi:antitoxin component of MazEF toxin-antitoxin module
MIKRLIRHGNSRAIVVDKALLEAAGISENAFFQISVNPSGGLVIQSVDDTNIEVFQNNFEKLNKKHKQLMKNLADL